MTTKHGAVAPLSRTWIKTLAVATLSPKAIFRRKQSQLTGGDEALTSGTSEAKKKPTIGLQTLKLLSHMVEYLDEHHRREDRLWHRDGVAAECEDLVACLRASNSATSHQRKLPDLAIYSPHSITTSIKMVLLDEYAPLASYTTSKALVEGLEQRDPLKSITMLIDQFKRIRAINREFLKLFLLHLQHVSACIQSGMSLKALSQSVGLLLIRSSEEKNHLNSKDMAKKRQQVALLMIENASSLPYDCPTELDVEIIPDHDMAGNDAAGGNVLQVSWDPRNDDFTQDSLEELLEKFGEITKIVVSENDSKALVAFASPANTETALKSTIPGLTLVRYHGRKEPSAQSSVPPPISSATTSSDIPGALSAATLAASNSSKMSRKSSLSRFWSANRRQPAIPKVPSEVSMHQLVTIPSSHSLGASDTELPPDNSESIEPVKFMVSLERPPSLVLTNRLQNDVDIEGSMIVEDLESMAGSISPTRLERCDEEKNVPSSQESGDEVDVELRSIRSAQQNQGDVFLLDTEEEQKDDELPTSQLSPAISSPKRSATAPVPFDTSQRPQKNRITVKTLGSVDSAHTQDALIPQTLRSADSMMYLLETQKPKGIQTPTQAAPLSPKLIDDSRQSAQKSLTELPSSPVTVISDSFTASREEFYPGKEATFSQPSEEHICPINDAAVQTMKEALLDMQKILQTSVASLRTSRTTEFERALFQLHTQLLGIAQQAIEPFDTSSGYNTNMTTSRSSVNQEFLNFLEVQARSQTRILEAEVRAGQELLRIHKSQHASELAALEHEATGLRLAKEETERLCAELRANLRSCRNELACHVASTTTIKRDKSDLEVRLASLQTKLRTREYELENLKVEFEEMREVAARAQLTGKDLPGQFAQVYPHAHDAIESASANIKIGLEPSLKSDQDHVNVAASSNIARLKAVKDEMRKQLQDKIEETKAAIRDISITSWQDTSADVGAQERELFGLQQQLDASKADMLAAMECSRRKLAQILKSTKPSDWPLSADAHVNAIADPSHGSPATEPPRTALSAFDPSALLGDIWSSLNAAPPTTRASQVTNNTHSYDMEPAMDLDAQRYKNLGLLAVTSANQSSEQYKNWLRDRAKRLQKTTLSQHVPLQAVKSAAPLALTEAQRSMERFQKTLESVQRRPH